VYYLKIKGAIKNPDVWCSNNPVHWGTTHIN